MCSEEQLDACLRLFGSSRTEKFVKLTIIKSKQATFSLALKTYAVSSLYLIDPQTSSFILDLTFMSC
jgi:hypothetical protein